MEWSEVCEPDEKCGVHYCEIEWLLGVIRIELVYCDWHINILDLDNIVIRHWNFDDEYKTFNQSPDTLEDAKNIVEKYINDQTTEILIRLTKFIVVE